MLLLDGSSTCDLCKVLSHPAIAQHNEHFLSETTVIAHAPLDRPSLCVMQGEFATVRTSQTQIILGSQDATTCLVAILACHNTGLAWAAHLDHPQLGDQDMAGMEDAVRQMQHPCLYLVGGYCDVRGVGPGLAQSFLQLLNALPHKIQVLLCCVGTTNTTSDGAPRCCQLVLDTSTWQPHPWLFTDRGPEIPRRFAAQHCRSSPRQTLLPVWDTQQQHLVLPVLDVSSIDSWQLMYYERMLDLPDQQLLSCMSTSPDHEPAWFCQGEEQKKCSPCKSAMPSALCCAHCHKLQAFPSDTAVTTWHDMRNMLRWLLSAQQTGTLEYTAAKAVCRYRLVGCSWEHEGAPATPDAPLPCGVQPAAAS